MRFVIRLLMFVIVILAAFWFTAENADEVVNIDLVWLRIRASLPLVIFTCVLGGMGLSAFVGWRAERRARGRRASRDAVPLGLVDPALDPLPGSPTRFDERYETADPEPVERYPLN